MSAIRFHKGNRVLVMVPSEPTKKGTVACEPRQDRVVLVRHLRRDGRPRCDVCSYAAKFVHTDPAAIWT